MIRSYLEYRVARKKRSTKQHQTEISFVLMPFRVFSWIALAKLNT